ncbi:pseudoazurin [Acetobacter sacchari]|uniref:Pseudoazurin n=1 Tax=Acetobacter sacchari TaxID=2661687 RepID=A0ABS3LX09_9PROT|nr:pseudoazurin [Acetobacter sacchari]MBO1360454.1 pseudoazurin [Acetobacter sacchari]
MKIAIALSACLCASPAAAFAGTVDVQMVNTSSDGGPGFSPDIVRIAPGDSVHFVASSPGHTVQSIPNMVPEGAQAFSSNASEDLTVTFQKPGIYGYKCGPHYMIGMVGVVIVGDIRNEGAVKKVSHSGMAASAFTTIFEQIDLASR